MSCPVNIPTNPPRTYSYGIETKSGTLVLARARDPKNARELYFASRIASMYGSIVKGPIYLGAFDG
jgi:hypothetical protein